MMLGTPIALTPKSKLNWKNKIKRRSVQSPRPDDYKLATPDSRVPSLSNSRGSTPASRRSRSSTPRSNFPTDDVFLTTLDVLDDHSINEFDLLKDSQVLKRGSLMIPPPPPKNKAVPQFPEQTPQIGPKVKPFVTNSKMVEAWQSECFICHESLETKLETEKLVPLSCGDCVHSECLQISAIFALESAIAQGKLSSRSSEEVVEKIVMPRCQGKRCQEERGVGAVEPLEESVVEELLSEAMLTIRLSSIPEMVRRNATPETPTPQHFQNYNEGLSENYSEELSENYSEELRTPKLTKQMTNEFSKNPITPSITINPITPNQLTNQSSNQSNHLPNQKNHHSPNLLTQNHISKNLSPQKLVYANRESQFFMMENFELRVKPEVSKAAFPNSPLTKSHIQKPSFLRKSFPPGDLVPVSLDEMRNITIKHMLQKYDIGLGLLTSLGSLKLVDKLCVSIHNQDFTPQVVYLFTDYLVVGHGSSPCLFPLKAKFSITTPETTVLRLESSKENVPLLKLHCEVSSVIEKWGIAVSDRSLSIPADLVTCTLTIEELMSAKSSNGKTSTDRASNDKTSTDRASKVSMLNKAAAHASRTSAELDLDFYNAFSRDSVAKASSRDVNDFEKELISYGLVPEMLDDTYETETSPLHIVRRTSNDIPVLLSYSDSEADLSSSDSDSDSDSELISEIKSKMI